ncbi:MAG: tetratricopeptide repeat protein [Thermodesulfobacteriota bacterium]
MRRFKWTWHWLAPMLIFSLAACNTYTYLPSVGKQAPAPGSPEAAAATPAGGPEIQPLGGSPAQQIQDLDAKIQKLESRLEELERRLPPPVAAKETKAPPKGKRTPGEKIAAKSGAKTLPAPPAGYPPAPGASDKAYSEGLSLYQNKKYGSARQKFHQYLKSQPKGAKAPEARYHLADSFYQEKQYKEAAVEFNKVALQYPKSILAPAAMLRQALAYQNLQQNPNYRTTLRKLVQAYPNSPEAQEAQKWLKEGK